MRPAGRRPVLDGHLLLLYHDESQRRTEVAAWVARGLGLGAKILYTEPEDESPERSLSGLLQSQPEAVAAMATDQIQVVPADCAAYDPAWQASVVERALCQGYPCVRWSRDATTAWDVMPQDRLADIERETDKLCRSTPLSVMCQYPGRASLEVFRSVSAEHGAGLRERLLQAAPIEGGIAVSGELDISNKNLLCSVLLAATTACESETFVLDLSGLGFLDLGGVRTLMAGTDPYRSLGGHVRLQAPQPHVDRLMRILGVDREQGFLTEAHT